MLDNKVAGEFVVGAVGQDELEFIVRPERFQILEREGVGFAGVRTLHIDDLDDLLRNARQGPFAAGLDQHLVVGVQKLLHQGDDFALLQHGFAAGDLDQSASRTQPGDFAEHFLQRHFFPTVETELAVTPGAAQVASGQTHKDAGQSGIRRFTLERFVDLGDLHEEPSAISYQLSVKSPRYSAYLAVV